MHAYDHKQRAPLGWLLQGGGVAFWGLAFGLLHQPMASWIMIATGAMMVGLGLAFGWLRVTDEGTCLAVRYGPLPCFFKTLPYRDILSVTAARSRWIDGWGIHWLPGRGWTYNLWGLDCVELKVGKQLIRIGTDDVPGLLEHLNQRIAASDDLPG